MNQKFATFLHNFIHALSANVVRLSISVVLTLLLPKLLGIEEYSYWQLYLFYVTYAAYSSMGWCEGTYLKYGGKDYRELNRSAVAGQFWVLAFWQVLFCGTVGSIFVWCAGDVGKRLILVLALVSAMFDVLRYQLQCILQATNRIRDFARVVTAERVMFFVFAVLALAVGIRDYHVLIYAEIAARILSMVYAMLLCKEVVFARFDTPAGILGEMKELISMGFKLLAATLASQLIIGSVRFFIEQRWGTVTFGKVSLTLSLSNMIITCIGAVSIVLFPVLKKMEAARLPGIYSTMRIVLAAPVWAILIFYAPFKALLTLWLPQYADSLHYLAVLLPICIYETRSLALINTYFKAYRKENLILYANLITVAVSLLCSFAAVYIIGSLDVTMVVIVLLMIFKSTLSEILLHPYLNVKILQDTVLEILLTVIFIGSSWQLGGAAATGIYTLAYAAYLLIKKKEIRTELSAVKEIVKGA